MKPINLKILISIVVFYTLLVCVAFSSNVYSKEEPANNHQFKQAYFQYTQELEKLKGLTKRTVLYNEQAKIVLYAAKNAYEQGREILSPESKNFNNLTANYADAAFRAGNNKLAVKIYKRWIDLLKEKFGKTSKELYEPYIGTGKSLAKRKSIMPAKRFFDKAIDVAIANYGEGSLAHGNALWASGKSLTDVGFGNKSIGYFETAYKIFRRENDARISVVKLYQGKTEMQRRAYASAIPHLEEAIILSDTEKDNQIELSSRAFLVKAYEKTGQREKATEQCLLIGRQTPWNQSQQAKPLYMENVKLSKTALLARKPGWVLVEFDISKIGFAENIKIVDSEGHGFEQGVLEVIKNARFAPKFENGQAVSAKSYYMFPFDF